MLDKHEGKKGHSIWFAKSHVTDSMLGTDVLEQNKIQTQSSGECVQKTFPSNIEDFQI